MSFCRRLSDRASSPYKFEASWQAFEFANHALDSNADLVILPMAWTTQEEYSEFTSKPLEPNSEAFNYWISRLEPLVRARREEEVIVVFANRTGIEGDTMYVGTSAVIGIQAGVVNVYGILGRGSKELLVVDTEEPPIAQLAFQSDMAELGLSPDEEDEEEEQDASPDDDIIFSPDGDEPMLLPRTFAEPNGLGISEQASAAPPATSRRGNLPAPKLTIPSAKPTVHFGDEDTIETPVGPSPTPSRLRPKVGFDEVQSMRDDYLASAYPTPHPMTLPLGFEERASRVRADVASPVASRERGLSDTASRGRYEAPSDRASQHNATPARRTPSRRGSDGLDAKSVQSFKTDSSVINGHVGSPQAARVNPYRSARQAHDLRESALSSPHPGFQQNESYGASSYPESSIPIGLNIRSGRHPETMIERMAAITPGPEDFRKTPRPRSPPRSPTVAEDTGRHSPQETVDDDWIPIVANTDILKTEEQLRAAAMAKLQYLARPSVPEPPRPVATSPHQGLLYPERPASASVQARAGREIKRPQTATGATTAVSRAEEVGRAEEASRGQLRVAAWFAMEEPPTAAPKMLRKAASSQRLRTERVVAPPRMRYAEDLPLSSFRVSQKPGATGVDHRDRLASPPPPPRPATANSTPYRPPSRQEAQAAAMRVRSPYQGSTSGSEYLQSPYQSDISGSERIRSPPLGTGAFERTFSPPLSQGYGQGQGLRSRGFSQLRQPEYAASPPYSVPDFSMSAETLVTQTESLASPRRVPPTPADPETPKAMMLVFSEEEIRMPGEVGLVDTEGQQVKRLAYGGDDVLAAGLGIGRSRSAAL